jgi:hypothetical protein
MRPKLQPYQVVLVFLGLALLFLWPMALHPNWVAFPPRSAFSDLAITHLPNAEYVRESLARFGQLPLWNAQIDGGQPFAADPLSGLWYPPNLALLVLPLPFGFNLLLALHLAWAGYGLWRLLQAEGVRPWPALLAAAAFTGAPKLVAHIGAGHFTLVCAVAWTPWLLLAVRGIVRPGGLRRGALAGAVMAAIFLADVRWTFYAISLGAAYCIWLFVRRDRLTPVTVVSPAAGSWRSTLAALGAAVVAATLLSAVLALPLAEFVRNSSRAGLTLEEAGVNSLPPAYILGLIVPDLGGFQEYMTYAGIVPLLLSFLGISRRTGFWLVAILVALSFALGTNFVLFPAVFHIVPGLTLLRVPARAWFVVNLGICMLAGHGTQKMMDGLGARIKQELPSLRLPAADLLLTGLLILTIFDLARTDSTLIDPRPRPAPTPAAAWLQAQPGLFRVYSPSYSLPLGDHLQHVDGVDPLQLATAVRFIAEASGVTAAGYSVTIPAFATTDLASANAKAVPSARLLGLLNVKYVAAEFDLEVAGLHLAQTFGATRIYENQMWRPRAWVEGAVNMPAVSWTPNRIAVQAMGPGQLVLSEAAYPGWRAWIDREAVPIESAAGLFRAVSLPAGRHEVVFEYQPLTLEIGGALTGLGLVLCVGLIFLARRR